MIRIMLITILVATLSGCAASGRIGDLPVVAEGAPSSQLVIIRASSIVGVTNCYYVSLDGNDIFSIRSGEYTKFTIPIGEHFVAVRCFGGWSPTWKEESKRIVALPNQAYYFQLSPNMNCAEINTIDEEAAKKTMAESTFISAEKISGK